MIDPLLKILCAFLVFAELSAFAVPPAPPTIPSGVEPAVTLRFFYNREALSYFGEATAGTETDHRVEKSVTLGGYYSLVPNLKVGAFYRRAYGLRHDADWNPSSGAWAWRDTQTRGEDFLILDATPRIQIEENWVAELKTRLLFDTFDGQETLTLRPGLTYFWLKNDEPFINFFLQFEAFHPFNYGVQSFVEKWLYLGGLYHVSKSADFGAYTAFGWETWGSTSAYLSRGGAPYVLTAQSTVLGAVAVFHLGN